MPVQRERVTDSGLRELAQYFHALKDVLRLRILQLLASRGELMVTELARDLRVSQPLVSFHLRPLRLLGLVDVRRSGREVYCSVNIDEIKRRQELFISRLEGSAISSRLAAAEQTGSED